MRTKRRFLMAIFIVIVLAWAIGMGGLVLWQTTSNPTGVEKTNASDSYEPVVETATNSSQSKFGELLPK